jgi:hypothetical protein
MEGRGRRRGDHDLIMVCEIAGYKRKENKGEVW